MRESAVGYAQPMLANIQERMIAFLISYDPCRCPIGDIVFNCFPIDTQKLMITFLYMDEKIIKKFWDNVEKSTDENGCWNWKGRCHGRDMNIPILNANNSTYYARRISLLICGRELREGYRVQVTCGDFVCVSPLHLIAVEGDRFWAKVNKLGDDDCWEWTAHTNTNGYGQFSSQTFGKQPNILSHVYSWKLHYGSPPPVGMCVCHTCDNRICINPSHLFLGTKKDNTQDMMNKNRHARGHDNNQSNLTDQDIINIRNSYPGKTYKELGKLYEVAGSTIGSIVRRETWTHI